MAELLPRLVAGERMALVSDAGMPAVSDPGARLIAAALDAGVGVTVLPGPSAVETGLVASGLAADGYVFVGFLPRREGELRTLLARRANSGYPIVAFESSQRLRRTLAVLADAVPQREIAICRELTKLHEEVVRGTAEELSRRFAEAPRGELVLILAAADAEEEPSIAEAAALEAVDELVRAGVARRQAARVVARISGASANELYRSSLPDS